MRTYRFVPLVMLVVSCGVWAFGLGGVNTVWAHDDPANPAHTHSEGEQGHSHDGEHGHTHSHEGLDDAHGGGHGGAPNPLAIDLDLAIWTGVVFAVLLGVLSKFAWPAISAALVEREERIENNISDALAKHEDAKQLLVEHEARLAGAADEVRALLEEARRDAENTKAQIVAEAKKAADLERDRAVRDVERAADAAMKNLAETSANLAVDLAGRVIKQNVTADQQAELVREALGRLAASSPSQN